MTDTPFDFDKVTDRRGGDSYKWEVASEAHALPMWVADMDFPTAPCIRRALEKRVEHGIFGYVSVPNAFYEATINWFARRHGLHMERQWMLYTSGVVPALSAIIKALTRTGDKVLALTPAYNCFFSSIRNNGCTLESSPLVRHGDSFFIDFDDFERRAALPEVKIFLLCNPHNPVGRVWTADELRRLGDICLRNGVFVISDEIHCELTMPGYTYTPYASLGPAYLLHSATCTSPSKAFNTAGLQIANILIADGMVRQAVDKAININEVCDVNPFGVAALVAAYNEGEPWLNALRNYLFANYTYLSDFFSQQLPQFPVTKLEATYLVWVDVSALGQDSPTVCRELRQKEQLWLNDGRMYGTDAPYVRINIACPRSVLADGLNRLARAWGRAT
ncbi:MAG: pyridoxal phosphate-dependent aminotransferase [Bacteroidaceae bacterium]|nr:pyridoxal phosphate-dependent aminotransferase [Bacteroidaceae bacterium]